MNQETDNINVSLDDIEDAPTFDLPAEGIYIAAVSLDFKDIKKTKFLELSYSVVSTVELSNPDEDEAPVEGTVFNELSSLEKDKLKWFKNKLKAIAEVLGVAANSPLSVLVESCKDVNLKIQLKHTESKDKVDDDGNAIKYPRVSIIGAA